MPNSNTFTVNSNGLVQVAASAPALSIYTQATYVFSFTVTDSSSLTAQAQLTITVLETEKPPAFSSYSSPISVPEGTLSGAAFSSAIVATDPNLNQFLTYSITACSPKMFAPGLGLFCPFAVAPTTGQLQVAALPTAALLADRNATFPAATPFAYNLTMTVTDDFVPPMSARTTFTVQLTKIAPRLAAGAATILANATAGSVALQLGPLTWTAYSFSTLSYAITSAAASYQTAEGATAFSVSATPGNVTVSSPAPAWNYNTKPSFAFAVTVSDSSQGSTLTSAATMAINLRHVNRAPSITGLPAVVLLPVRFAAAAAPPRAARRGAKRSPRLASASSTILRARPCLRRLLLAPVFDG